ncbi:hypothetical protein TRVL_08872 [Trypanosoma vivax]|nr:hypothetical protein TRVL_08872 [Trypanosoma vivax]
MQLVQLVLSVLQSRLSTGALTGVMSDATVGAARCARSVKLVETKVESAMEFLCMNECQFDTGCFFFKKKLYIFDFYVIRVAAAVWQESVNAFATCRGTTLILSHSLTQCSKWHSGLAATWKQGECAET